MLDSAKCTKSLHQYPAIHVRLPLSAPLSVFDQAALGVQPGCEVIFMCRSGARTGAYCDRLAARVEGPACVLDGGLNSWKAAGLPVTSAAGGSPRTV